MQVEPNNVYVIPPNADLAILEGVLHVMTPPRAAAPHGPHLPVDYFFRSLADDQGTRAIGVVLSGTGTDGTFGLHAIKETGGITFAQDPATAKYDGMPRSALESGWADFCLPPAGIARGAHEHQPAPLPLARQGAAAADAGEHGQAHRPHPHRVRQRPQLLQADHHRAPHRAAHGAAQDREAGRLRQVRAGQRRRAAPLYKDMLISVTSFFRDRGAVRGAQDQGLPAPAREQGGRFAPSASGCRPARRARRRTRSRSACSSSWATARPSTACRSSAPTSTTSRCSARAAASIRRTSRSTSRPSACSASSSRRTRSTRSRGASATWSCSRSRTSPRTRRSPGSISSAAATCSSTCARGCRRRCCASCTTRSARPASCARHLGDRGRASE